MDIRHRAAVALESLRDIRTSAINNIRTHSGSDALSAWLPLRSEMIDSFFSLAETLQARINAWNGLGIDARGLFSSESNKRDRAAVLAVGDSLSATEAILKDAAQLHAAMIDWAQVVRLRFNSMRPEAREYWQTAQVDGDFQLRRKWQKELRERRANWIIDRLRSITPAADWSRYRETEPHSNLSLFQVTGIGFAIADPVKWSEVALPRHCFAWAIDEIAGVNNQESGTTKSSSKRGRPTKERQTESRAAFYRVVSDTPALLDQPEVLAELTGVSKSTISRWAKSLRDGNRSRR